MMPDATELLIEPKLRLRDGRIVGSLADMIALLRQHRFRPGIDVRDEVLHQLERAQTDAQRQQAAEAFLAWVKELDLLAPAPRPRAKS
jgi:hypothetical protein